MIFSAANDRDNAADGTDTKIIKLIKKNNKKVKKKKNENDDDDASSKG